MSNTPPEAHGGPVPKPKTYHVPGRVDEEDCLGRSKKPFQVVAVAFMFICLAIMGGLIWLVASIPVITSAKHKLELKQMGDIDMAFREACEDPERQQRLSGGELRDSRGEEFYELALKQEVFDSELVSDLVSLNSRVDTKADKAWLDEPDGRMPTDACSYTAPIARQLPELLKLTGDERVVLVTFNSENWNNYPEHGVAVLWSDGSMAEYLTLDDASDEFGITEEQWADPAGKLFGKKHPFQHTYE